MDATGRLYNGDELLYLMAADRMGRDEHVPGVVGTLMTNMAVEVALLAKGVKFVRAKVGDRYVLEELARHHWVLGGEGSGHLLALDQVADGAWNAWDVQWEHARLLHGGLTIVPARNMVDNLGLGPGATHTLRSTPIDQVRGILAAGRDAILTIDPQGARQVRVAVPDALLVFVKPPTMEDLAERLRGRGSESAQSLARRRRDAEHWMADTDDYDHVVVNETGHPEEAAERIWEIIQSEARREPPRRPRI